VHCPNCGTRTSEEQKFCRACGLGLEKVVQVLGEQMPRQLDESLLARKERLERLGMIALSIFGAGLLGLLIYGVAYKVIFVQGRIFEALVLLALIAVAACGVVAAILFAEAKEIPAKRLNASSPESVLNETAGNLLPEGLIQPLPSVTDRTTELLVAEKETKAPTSTKEM
jgi:hypothetical protein